MESHTSDEQKMERINDYVGCYIRSKRECGQLRVDTAKVNRLVYTSVPKKQRKHLCSCYKQPKHTLSLFDCALSVIMQYIHHVDFQLPHQFVEDVFVANFDKFRLLQG